VVRRLRSEQDRQILLIDWVPLAVGFLIDPPRPIEGEYVAIFAQTDMAEELAFTLLRERGFDVKPFPLMGDLAFEGFGGIIGGTSLFGGETLVCVPESQAAEATAVLVNESGLIEEQP
jgi:hypothetical protein